MVTWHQGHLSERLCYEYHRAPWVNEQVKVLVESAGLSGAGKMQSRGIYDSLQMMLACSPIGLDNVLIWVMRSG